MSAIIQLDDKNISLEMVKLLLDRLDVNDDMLPRLLMTTSLTCFGKIWPLQEACALGNIELCNYLVGKIDEMPTKFNYQITEQKVFPGFSLLSLLIIPFIDFGSSNIVVIDDEIKLINRIIQSGCNKEIRDSSGKTLLHHAVAVRGINFVERILAESFDNNALDNDGYNLFHAYISGASIISQSDSEIDSTIKLLLRYGVCINSLDNSGLTALYRAIALSNSNAESIVTLMINNGAKPSQSVCRVSEVMQVCRYRSVALVELFCQHGCSLHTIDYSYGMTALLLATMGSNLPVIKYLVNTCGLDINTVDIDNNTCLHIAAMNTNPKQRDATTKLLIRLGANQNAINSFGFTYKRPYPCLPSRR